MDALVGLDGVLPVLALFGSPASCVRPVTVARSACIRQQRRHPTVAFCPMADQSTQSITIAAPAADVMAVIADFAQYPVWAKSVKKAEVLESFPDGRAKRVAFSIDAGMAKDDYELDYIWTGDERVDWTLRRGQMQRSQVGSYVLRELPGLTDVTYSLVVELTIPMLGLLKRKLEKMVMDVALKELRNRVESMPR
jgi:hypothetical protein